MILSLAFTPVVLPSIVTFSMQVDGNACNGNSEFCTSYFSADIRVNQLAYIPSGPAMLDCTECMDACSLNAACVAVDWIDPIVSPGADVSCYLFKSTSQGKSSLYPIWSALLLGYTRPQAWNDFRCGLLLPFPGSTRRLLIT